MQPLFEHRLTLAGFQTRALELEGNGAPLLLLHGYSDSADTWRTSLALLARHDRRALAVDLPGFGSASRLRPGPILPQLDEFASALSDHVGDDRAVAVGNSLGGTVALRLAQHAGTRLDGMVGIAPAGLDMAGWFALIERDVVLTRLLAAPVPLPPRVVRAAVGRIYRTLAFARPGAASAQVVSAFTSHHSDRATVARYLDTARRMLPELRAPFDLPAIACPVLLVWGTRDRMVFASGAQRVIDALPETRLELIEGCGHCPQIEAAPRLVELLLDFPEGTSSTQAA